MIVGPTESKISGFVSKSNQHWLLTPLLCLTSVKLIGSKTLTLCWWDCIFNQICASCAPPRSEIFLDLSQNLISSGSCPYYYTWQVWNWFVQKPWRYGGETAFLPKFSQVLAPHGVKNYRICLKILSALALDPIIMFGNCEIDSSKKPWRYGGEDAFLPKFS